MQGYKEQVAGISYPIFFLISYYHGRRNLYLWIIRLWTYKIVGGNIYYHG